MVPPSCFWPRRNVKTRSLLLFSTGFSTGTHPPLHVFIPQPRIQVEQTESASFTQRGQTFRAYLWRIRLSRKRRDRSRLRLLPVALD